MTLKKVLNHYPDQIQQVLDDLEDNGKIERVAIIAARNIALGSKWIKPIVISPNSATYKRVRVTDAARLPTATIDVSKHQFPLLPSQVSFPRTNGKGCSKRNLSIASLQVAFSPETQKLFHFLVDNEQYKLKRGLYEIKAVPRFSTRIVTFIFALLGKRNEIITNIANLLLQAQKTSNVWTTPEFYTILNSKLLQWKSFFFSLRLSFLAILLPKQNQIVTQKNETTRQMKRSKKTHH